MADIIRANFFSSIPVAILWYARKLANDKIEIERYHIHLIIVSSRKLARRVQNAHIDSCRYNLIDIKKLSFSVSKIA